MYQNGTYATLSLELHLFFARIMKEHALFIMASLAPVDSCFMKEAKYYKQEFERLLCNAATLSDGVVSRGVLCSGEVVTEFTANAERQTECLTGICINKDITAKEKLLRCSGGCCNVGEQTCRQVQMLNQTAIRLLNGLIALKEKILNNVLCCKMFTVNYPLLLEHILREAKLYRSYVCCLENDGYIDNQTMRQTEQFWNQIMMEHAMFIRGLLDPSEQELVSTADSFAKEYATLLDDCREAYDQTIMDCRGASLAETIKFRDFKTAGTKGIEACKIRSIILPLLADHVLREANHYIRLLSDCD